VRLAVGEALLPGITPPSPLILPDQVVDRLWHIPFNQLKETNEKLVRGREDIFFGAEFSASAGTSKLPGYAVQYYIDGLASGPEALHATKLPSARRRGIMLWHREQAAVLTMPLTARGSQSPARRGRARLTYLRKRSFSMVLVDPSCPGSDAPSMA
jgi:hypothetical protein